MIKVTQYKIANDRKSIQLDIEVDPGQVVNKIQLWNEGTYKSPTNVKDLTSLIVGAGNTESITISTTDAGVSEFNGIYIAQIESDDVADVPGIVGTTSLTRYYSVISQLLCNVDLSCLNCNPNFQNAALLDLYVESMKNSIILGRFRDAIETLKKINIFEEIDCAECSNINPVVSTAGNIVSIGVIDCVLETT